MLNSTFPSSFGQHGPQLLDDQMLQRRKGSDYISRELSKHEDASENFCKAGGQIRKQVKPQMVTR